MRETFLFWIPDLIRPCLKYRSVKFSWQVWNGCDSSGNRRGSEGATRLDSTRPVFWFRHPADRNKTEQEIPVNQAIAEPCWSTFPLTGHLFQSLYPLVTIIPPFCHLADMGNNTDTWPASKLITTLDGIDPSSRGFPSRVVWALFGFLLPFPFSPSLASPVCLHWHYCVSK